LSAEHPGAQAVAALEIEDIFVLSINASVTREFNQTERPPEVVSMQRLRVDSQGLWQTRAPASQPDHHFTVLRYYVLADLVVAKAGSVPENDEMKIEDRLANINLIFAADYRCKAERPSDEALSAFIHNVVFHVWPYWREAVHSECARLRLPAVTIPMMKPGQQLPGATLNKPE